MLELIRVYFPPIIGQKVYAEGQTLINIFKLFVNMGIRVDSGASVSWYVRMLEFVSVDFPPIRGENIQFEGQISPHFLFRICSLLGMEWKEERERNWWTPLPVFRVMEKGVGEGFRFYFRWCQQFMTVTWKF